MKPAAPVVFANPCCRRFSRAVALAGPCCCAWGRPAANAPAPTPTPARPAARARGGDPPRPRAAWSRCRSPRRSPAPASGWCRTRRPAVGNEPRELVIDPLIDANTGEQTVGTVQMGEQLERLIKSRVPRGTCSR